MAQLVEHIVHIDGVTGSSPVATTKNPRIARFEGFYFRAMFESCQKAAMGDLLTRHDRFRRVLLLVF